MRILFATDGSRSADRARDLLARSSWPADTVITVATTLETRAEIVGAPWVMPEPGDVDRLESDLVRHAREALDDAERALEHPGLRIETVLLRGRAASSIVDEARVSKADLIVVGSRGHGPIASMLLGSVSSEIVDHASCPVLVVRDDTISSVILAADGSAGSARAARRIRTWPFLHGLPVDVVAVAETMVPWNAGMASGLYDQVMASYATDLETARAETAALAERTAATFRSEGVPATPHVLDGDPAHELVEFARHRPHALLVVGTRGHGGLTRLVLGSVARNVLLHAAGSVLVVRAVDGEPDATTAASPPASQPAGSRD